MTRRLLLASATLALAAVGVGPAQEPKSPAKPADKKPVDKKPAGPAPTAANVAYGKHERQVLDFWQAKSDKPTPVVFCIHGGGWRGGDKAGYAGLAGQLVPQGISVVAINYRLINPTAKDQTSPPVKAPLEDAARALQFVRSKATEWNLDKTRIGATGGSAGGASSLWLAFHDDLADPKSDDPVARESTRLYCAAVNGAQVSLDPKVVRGWLANYTYGAHAFGLRNLNEVEEKRADLADWIKEYSPITHVTKDDPPIGLYYTGPKEPKPGVPDADPTHSPVLGQKLAERLKEAGVQVVYHSTAEPNAELRTAADFLVAKLKK